MGWVKFTAKAAAAPPQAMDSKRVGLRVVAIDMVRGNSYCLIFDGWRNVIAKTMTLPEVGWLTTQDAGREGTERFGHKMVRPRTRIPSIC